MTPYDLIVIGSGPAGRRAAIQAEAGTLLVRGCEFRENKAQIEIGAAVRRAMVTDNIFTGSSRITNHSQHSVVISNNAGDQ